MKLLDFARQQLTTNVAKQKTHAEKLAAGQQAIRDEYHGNKHDQASAEYFLETVDNPVTAVEAIREECRVVVRRGELETELAGIESELSEKTIERRELLTESRVVDGLALKQSETRNLADRLNRKIKESVRPTSENFRDWRKALRVCEELEDRLEVLEWQIRDMAREASTISQALASLPATPTKVFGNAIISA